VLNKLLATIQLLESPEKTGIFRELIAHVSAVNYSNGWRISRPKLNPQQEPFLSVAGQLTEAKKYFDKQPVT
jgi:hypothetical protein